MKKINIIIGLLIFQVLNSYSQTTFTNGRHSIELSGSIAAFGNIRWIDTIAIPLAKRDYKKDRINLRDMQLQLEGRHQGGYEWKFQADIADMISGSTTGDPENPGLMDAWVELQQLPVNIKIGYQKVPFSRSNHVSFNNSPFWSRAEIARGQAFSRRDVGVTLNKSFLRQTINLFAGIYSGQGESVIGSTDNDKSGKPEYIARAEFAWPSRFRYRDIDLTISPIPMFFVGINGRYSEKGSITESEYSIKTVNGKKQSAGADFAFQFKGFSIQAEGHLAKLSPLDKTDYGTLLTKANTDYFLYYGAFLQGNYFVKDWKSVFSVRYDYFDPSDVKSGDEYSAIVGGYNYQLDGRKSVIKIQFWHNLKKPTINQNATDFSLKYDPIKWTDQLRIGYQFSF